MTEKDVLRSLVGFQPSCRWSPSVATLVTHSTGVSRWESDLLVIHKTSWVDEVEVKVSVSDFRAEFKKKAEKHLSLQRGYDLVERLSPPSHDSKLEFHGMSERQNYLYRVPTIIRRFWFALPAEIFEKVEAEIPAYAGILVIGPEEYRTKGFYKWHENKRPKQLPCRKATDEDIHRALLSVYYRAWAAKAKEELL